MRAEVRVERAGRRIAVEPEEPKVERLVESAMWDRRTPLESAIRDRRTP